MAGRPPKFETEEELQSKIDEYFEYIKGEFTIENKVKTNKDGSVEESPEQIWTRYPETPSITGLAYFVGFESRQSLYDYEKQGEFSYSIKRAKLQIEISYEKYLLTNTATGAIFALKNFGWTDKITQEHSGPEGKPIESSNSLTVTVVRGLRDSPANSEYEIANEIAKELGE